MVLLRNLFSNDTGPRRRSISYRHLRTALVFGVLAGASATPVMASPILYTLTTTLPFFNAWDINEKGQVAGWSTVTNQAQTYMPGIGIQTLPMVAGVTSSVAYTINEASQVAGRVYGLPNYDQYGYYVNNGFLYTPGGSPATRTITGGIGFDHQLNESGQVVYLGGPLAPVPNANNNVITGVHGEYASGYTTVPGEANGQSWRRNNDGTFTFLHQYIPTPESQAYGINASGTVVGREIGGTNGLSAFVYSDGLGALDLFSVTDPASLTGWKRFSSAQDITSDGKIIGWGVYDVPDYGSSYISGFILTPITTVPEPGVLALMLAAIAAAACALRLRTWQHRSSSVDLQRLA